MRDHLAELEHELTDTAADVKRRAAVAWGEAYTDAKQRGLTAKQCDRAGDKAFAEIMATLDGPAIAPVGDSAGRGKRKASAAPKAAALELTEVLHALQSIRAELLESRSELAELRAELAEVHSPASIGARGGKARASRMTPAERSAAAKAAVEVRWERKRLDRYAGYLASQPAIDVDNWHDDPAEYIGLDAAYSRAMDLAASTGRVDCYDAAGGMEVVAYQLAGKLNSEGWEPDGGEIHGGLHFRYRCADSGEVAGEVRSLSELDLANATPEHISAVRHALFMRDQQQSGYGRAKSNDALRGVYINRQGGRA